MIKILVITGPTGVGKTKLGIKLAKRFNGEIISADSQQVYKGLDVERGKDRSFPQWGLDLAERPGTFHVAAFVKFAKAKIADITKRGKLPIIVGGSGLYLRALIDPLATIDIPPDTKLRAANLSVPELQKMVRVPMNDSDWQNPRRLIRAIEVARANIKFKMKNEKYSVLVIGLEAPREVLAAKIAVRRADRPDLVPKETALVKKQLLYQKKFLKARWFDITKPLFNNDIECLVKEFVQPLTNKNKNTPTI